MRKVEFLATVNIFQDLYEEELETLAAITDEYECDEGAVIAYQRDIADRMYIVRSGRLFASRVDEQGIVRDSRSYLPGDYFDDVWLFKQGVHTATVKAAAPSRFMTIKEIDFLELLQERPELVDYLHLSEKAQEEVEKTPAISPIRRRSKDVRLMEDELVLWERRRSSWLLLKDIALPLLGLFLIPIIFFITLQVQVEVSWVIGLSALPLVIVIIIVGLQVWDWYKDYLMITTKHIIHYEFDLPTFKTSINKTPIDRIQSVEVAKPDIITTLLNVGSVRVTTAAQEAVIFFDYLKDPERVRDILNELREEVKALDAGRMQANMRSLLEDHFAIEQGYRKISETPVSAPPLTDDEGEEEDSPPSFWDLVRHRLMRKKRTTLSIDEGIVSVYYRHWLALVPHTYRPIIITLILMGLTILLYTASGGDPGVLAIAGTITAIIGFLTFAWFFWQLEDWRNDEFRVTDRYVIDVDRRPFGFGESRTQAELGNVQNVTTQRSGLWRTIFNYGDVNIETAGALADITFDDVRDPSGVQSDIFHRRSQFQQRQREEAEIARRKELAVLFDVYHQATEQERVPKRTPTSEDIE